MKFKIGDKVRIAGLSGWYRIPESIRLIHRIVGYACDSTYKNGYVLDGDWSHVCVWFDDELELVKEKFDISKYPGKYVMHCRTKEESDVFHRYLDSIGKRWTSGHRYTEWFPGMFRSASEGFAYNFNAGLCDRVQYYRARTEYTILEFDNYDWSDIDMKKEFTKKDLRNGDVIKRRNGSVEIVCVETGTMICKNGFNLLRDVNNDLTDVFYGADIVAVRRPNCPNHCSFSAFDHKMGELVYERKEVEEMTLEEVCKALGKEIKIVKN